MYDRAPIVVTPNVCALPERGGRKFIGGNSNQGGVGYFHPHAKFQVETVSPTIFSASVTVGNVNECGSVELLMKKRSGPVVYYDYENYDQYSSHVQHVQNAPHVVSSLLFDHSSDSSDIGVFYTTPATPLSSTSISSSIPYSSLGISPRNVHNTSSATSSPGPTAGSSSNNNTASHSDKHQDKNETLVDHDVGRKKRWKNRQYAQNRVEGECRTKRTKLTSGASDSYTPPELELEGCLGGF